MDTEIADQEKNQFKEEKKQLDLRMIRIIWRTATLDYRGKSFRLFQRQILKLAT